jgi:hypothetical protein
MQHAIARSRLHRESRRGTTVGMTNTTRLAIALVAVLGCKGKDEAAPTPRPAEPAAPAPAPAPAPAEPAAKPAEPVAEPAKPSAPTAAIKLAELPAGWDRTDEGDTAKLEYVAATNETRFPVDNAMFTFTLGVVADAAAPKDAAAYGEWHAGQMKDKVLKTEKLGDATYFEFHGPRDAKEADRYFQVVTTAGGKLLHCGGSLYRDKDYNQIPKIRDAVIAQAKQLCASMKL